MIPVCAWCKRIIWKYVTLEKPLTGLQSHGACQECYEKLVKEIAAMPERRKE